MDDRRFDTLTRAFGQGGSRRTLLKGLLGLGGVTAAGTALFREADAARRGQSGPSVPTAVPTAAAPPTEPPAPAATTAPSCPGLQTPCDADCCCPAGNTICGPDCCPDGQAQCCDNACCFGTCFGEELCCPFPRAWCEFSAECCPDGWRCCPGVGCISPDQCCTSDDCPAQDCMRGSCTDGRVCDYSFDCTLADGCCESGNVCAPEGCNPENGTCEQTAALTCGCVADGNGGTVSCGACGAGAPCCNNGTCGACAPCVCPHGPNLVYLTDGTTRSSNGGAVCLSPCTSNADCACGRLCVARFEQCLPGQPIIDCTRFGRPPGAYCAEIGVCSPG